MKTMNEPSNVSLFRKYFFEYSILALSGVVAYLFFQYRELNKYVRENLTEIVIETKLTIQENTKAVVNFNNNNSKNKTNENSN